MRIKYGKYIKGFSTVIDSRISVRLMSAFKSSTTNSFLHICVSDCMGKASDVVHHLHKHAAKLQS